MLQITVIQNNTKEKNENYASNIKFEEDDYIKLVV